MFYKHVKISLIIGFIVLVFLIGNFCVAAGFLNQDINDKINIQAGGAGTYGGYDISHGNRILNLSQVVINALLSLIGVILIAYILYGGYYWMTARGDEEKVNKAKDTITRAVIGVIIIISAYAISLFVIGRLEQGNLSNNNPAAVQGQQ